MQNVITETSYKPLLSLETTLLDWIKAGIYGIAIPLAIMLYLTIAWAFAYVIIAAAFYMLILRRSTPAGYLLLLEATMVIAGYAFLVGLTMLGAVMAAF